MSTQNELYPIFLKVNQLNVLIVGGGKVAVEKLGFLLKSSPNAQVTVWSKDFDTDLLLLAAESGIKLVKREYSGEAIVGKQLVIAATNVFKTNQLIYRDAKQFNTLVNVADTPALCDFYLGGIVTKGNVKIAISTNGKSPTIAKRMRQFFEEIIPNDVSELVTNLGEYRKTIEGDFQQKVKELNRVTEQLIKKEEIA